MNKTLRVLILLSVIYSFSAAYTYSHPEGWPDLCKNGNRQSPIDFPSEKVYITDYVTNSTIRVISSHYNIKSCPISEITYKNLNIDVSGVGFIMVEKDKMFYRYDAENLHFHFNSEHTISGVKADMEIHVVHVKNNDFLRHYGYTNDPDYLNKRMVIATTVNIGYQDNPNFDTLNLEKKGQTTKDFDLSKFILPLGEKDEPTFYHYLGSLTFPNPDCVEDINWVVVEKPIYISRRQYDLLTKWIISITEKPNSRAVQPRKSRKILKIKNKNGWVGHSNGSYLYLNFLFSLFLFFLII